MIQLTSINLQSKEKSMCVCRYIYTFSPLRRALICWRSLKFCSLICRNLVKYSWGTHILQIIYFFVLFPLSPSNKYVHTRIWTSHITYTNWWNILENKNNIKHWSCNVGNTIGEQLAEIIFIESIDEGHKKQRLDGLQLESWSYTHTFKT